MDDEAANALIAAFAEEFVRRLQDGQINGMEAIRLLDQMLKKAILQDPELEDAITRFIGLRHSMTSAESALGIKRQTKF